MSTSKSIVVSVWASVIASALVALLVVNLQIPKVGIVRAQDLIAKNAMFKDQMDNWQNHETSLNANIITLEQDIKVQTSEFEKIRGELSQLEQKEHLQQLDAKRQEYYTYVNSAQETAGEQQNRIVKSVLDRINQVMEEYGREHGFDVILGSGGEGNILYGGSAIDITDEVLEVFNKEYYDESN